MKKISKPASASVPRLESLDVLRGFDLFLLVFLQPVLVAVGRCTDAAWYHSLLYHFDHETWIGFRFWDLVMPLFLFMTGTAMPFAFAKMRSKASSSGLVYRRIIRRVVLLFLLGMVVQGNLLGFDLHRIYFYSNTLQAIATGYLISAIILLNCRLRMQIAVTSILIIVYSIPMYIGGDFTPEGNFAELIDRAVLGRFRDGVWYDESGMWHFSEWYTYTWIWSSITFGVSVMLGAFAGTVIRTYRESPRAVLLRLCTTGVALLVAAWLWSFSMPVIKRLWTASMTLLAGGWCFLLLALSYYVIDVKKWHRGLMWLKIYGMNSITAYVLGEVINFRSMAASVSYGLRPILGEEWYAAWLTLANFLILFIILRIMYRHKIFLKV